MIFLQQQPANVTSIISILPIISFVLGIAIAVLQLYVTARMAKIEEKLTNLFRAEMRDLEKRMYSDMKEVETNIKSNMHEIKSEMVTKEHLSMVVQMTELKMKQSNQG